MDSAAEHLGSVAIIGMIGRFPGAPNLETFWQNLKNGVESISFFSAEELAAAGVDLATQQKSNYVNAAAVLDDIDLFDAPFFNFTPREAEITDPQHRLFLECAWEALEQAGYAAGTDRGVVGVYAGISINTYLLNNLFPNRDLRELIGGLEAIIGNDKDHLTTRVSYKFDLKGPSVNVQTACSTSLVAVHLACQSLLDGECDLALAGAASVSVPQKAGYLFHEGGIASPDGHCRAFDAQGRGTVRGDGVAVVVLKRLQDALADNDYIHAVIRGSAINNDGADKVAYTAPSVEGQMQVIADALTIADVDLESISYVEAHGTGTYLGDPIEVAALSNVFRAATQKKRFCGIGSVKSNIGHLDTVAGIAGLIKTVLALQHKQIPPTLHFKQPNPRINFEDGPFYVNHTLSPWQPRSAPRRAGVSSFGIGGTNAHLILEEAPVAPPIGPSRPQQVLVLSAKTNTALEALTANLATYLQQQPDVSVADVAYTLQVGRRAFSHRLMVVCHSREDAIEMLARPDRKRVFTYHQKVEERSVAFMFPGQGAQHVNMALGLYQNEPAFREHVDHCAQILRPLLQLDLRQILYPPQKDSEAATQQLNQTWLTQPAVFVIEYALAQLWITWGIFPRTMIGHSLGEYVAACLAGVISLEDALALVAIRGQLIQQLPVGAMLTVSLPEHEIRPLLTPQLSLAAHNGPSRCVVSGPTNEIDALQQQLRQRQVPCRRLRTSHAFHSPMITSVLDAFTAEVEKVELQPPQIPYISNVTGTWIKPDEAVNPDYWARHLRQTVRFAEGLTEIVQEPNQIFLEVGPGQTLNTLVKRRMKQSHDFIVLPSLPHPRDQYEVGAFLLNTLGQIWLFGGRVNWADLHLSERRRLPLPTYPFERRRYWISPPAQQTAPAALRQPARKPDVADWFYVPSWKRAMLPGVFDPSNWTDQGDGWLLFANGHEWESELMATLQSAGQDAFVVTGGSRFEKVDEQIYQINPQRDEDYGRLLHYTSLPTRIIHLWNATSRLDPSETQQKGYRSLLKLAQAIKAQKITRPVEIWALSSNLYQVTGKQEIHPEKATIAAACHAIPRQHPNITCHHIDILFPPPAVAPLINQIMSEIQAAAPDTTVALRGPYRWLPVPEAIRLHHPGQPTLRENGTYLITNGPGSLGIKLANSLVQRGHPNLVLVQQTERLHAKDRRAQIELEETTVSRLEHKLTRELGIDKFPDPAVLEQMVNALCTSYICQYLVANHIEIASTRTYSKQAVKEKLKILPQFDKFYEFFLAVLAADNVIKVEGDQIEFLKNKSDIPPSSAIKNKLQEKYPELKNTLAFLEHCVNHYDQALTGEIEAISVLYPEGAPQDFSEDNLERFSNARIYRALIKELVTELARQKTGRPLKILEVGGGNGVLTWMVAPALADLPVAYHFTDLGRGFVINAEKKAAAAGFDFMSFGTLDISADPAGQGYHKYDFDIILAYNVIHATPSIEETIGHLKKLLVPQGLMLILELSHINRWQTMMSGLAEGWWFFADEALRKHSPIISPEQWQHVMQEQVFEQVLVYPQEARKRKELDHALIIAQQQATPLSEDYQEWLSYRRQKEQQQMQRKVQLLQESGAEVMLANANVTDEIELAAVLAQAYEKFGPIHGVIHALLALEDGDEEGVESLFLSTIQSVQVLEKVLAETPLDFTLLLSSSTLLPQTAVHTAMRTFMNAFAASHNQANGSRWISVDWNVRPESDGLVPELNGEALLRLLSLAQADQVLVSPYPIQSEIEQWQTIGWVASPELPEEPQEILYPRPDLSETYVAPRNEAERILANIWGEVLGIAQVGIYDDFFELGGDSLLSIQAGNRAKQQGINLTPQQILERRNIAKLAVQREKAMVVQAEQGVVTGPVPLTPLQYWFFEESLYPHHGNAAMLFAIHQPVDTAVFNQAVQHLLLHHDTLRSRFRHTEAGWQQSVIPPAPNKEFTYINLSSIPDDQQSAVIEGCAAQIQTSLDLVHGPLMRVVQFSLGSTNPTRLLIIIHHLLVDGPSLHILLEDFVKVIEQLSQEHPVHLPLKTTPYKQWAERQKEYAQSTAVRQELAYWLAPARKQMPPLPVDKRANKKRNTVAASDTLTLWLNTQETRLLLQELPAAYNCRIDDILLTALAQTFNRWTGNTSLLVDLSHHGRETFFEDLDLARTVGWVTYYIPVLLDLGNTTNLQDALQAVQRQLRSIPNNGFSYCLLRYLSNDKSIIEKLKSYPQSQLFFNYAGQGMPGLSSLFLPARESYGPRRNPQDTRAHLVEINGNVAGDQLQLYWTYSRNIHHRATIERLIEGFEETISAFIDRRPSAK